jgi:menaquinone-dependent protoporphyrinogen oxidase
MTGTILVTYATRTGSTKGVAETIARALNEKGAAVELRPVAEVTDLAPYRAVVAGSAVQASSWLPEALDFVRAHRTTLEQKPFAAFLVCMTMAMRNNTAREQVPTFMQPVRDIVPPDSEGYFAGILDIDKVPYRQARWGFRVSTLFGVWKQGDHRDWKQIRAWAESIHPLLTGQAGQKT